MPEFALLGRSNAGKSTFINTLAGINNLAKTSNTPGKTRLINHFELEADFGIFSIADLPGYGYAKVSKTTQNEWGKNLEEYLLKRQNLVCCFQFIDSRHGILENDIQMINWLKSKNIPFINIVAKCDLTKLSQISSVVKQAEVMTGAEAFPFSSKKVFYKDKIFDFIKCNIN